MCFVWMFSSSRRWAECGWPLAVQQSKHALFNALHADKKNSLLATGPEGDGSHGASCRPSKAIVSGTSIDSFSVLPLAPVELKSSC